MRKAILVLLIIGLRGPCLNAQSPPSVPSAANTVQQAQPIEDAPLQPANRELTIPAGVPLDIEAAYTVNSREVQLGDLLTFRVLVPIKIDGITVIDTNSLVTARVVRAKRGGHWGKSGKIVWAMQDVVAVDLTRVPLTVHQESGTREINGTSHGGQVATTAIVFGVLLFPASPLALMSGFRRGEDAILPQGRRFVVFVEKNTVIKVPRQD